MQIIRKVDVEQFSHQSKWTSVTVKNKRERASEMERESDTAIIKSDSYKEAQSSSSTAPSANDNNKIENVFPLKYHILMDIWSIYFMGLGKYNATAATINSVSVSINYRRLFYCYFMYIHLFLQCAQNAMSMDK